MNDSTWRLESAEERNEAAPDSFFIPPREKRESLEVGDHVKLLFRGPAHGGDEVVERMWVDVTSAASKEYVGELINEPSELQGINVGDLVVFRPEHVAAYAWSPEELGYDPDAFAWVRTDSSVPGGTRPTRVSLRPTELRSLTDDSGWILGRGDETASEDTDTELFRWIDLGWLTDLFPELEEVFRAGEGQWRWDESRKSYARVA